MSIAGLHCPGWGTCRVESPFGRLLQLRFGCPVFHSAEGSKGQLWELHERMQ